MTIDGGIVIVAILIFWGWREFQHDRERKDLYSRLMAKDLTEYAVSTAPKGNNPKRSRNFIKAGVQRFYKDRAEAGD
jgi:hypothetical protein